MTKRRESVVRGILASDRQAMAVVLPNAPPPYNWGWFSREDQRMHLQPVSRQHLRLHYKVWLENRGRRVIEPEPGIPAKILKPLTKKITEWRKSIEAEWVAFMIANGWLTFRLDGEIITLTAYPKSPNRFTRVLDLAVLIPNEQSRATVTPEIMNLNKEFAWLEIFTNRPEGYRITEPLAPVLWVGDEYSL